MCHLYCCRHSIARWMDSWVSRATRLARYPVPRCWAPHTQTLSICTLSICPSTCLSISIYLPIYLSICPSTYPSTYLPTERSISRLKEAIASLEGFVKADPRNRTHHALCANLAALYQMTDGAAASKQGLERLVVDYAPDDFDIAALTPLA